MSGVTVTPESLAPGTWESFTGDGDPQQRFRIYRLCECALCDGVGKCQITHVDEAGVRTEDIVRCKDCRGEGRVKQLVATTATPAGVGEALVTLGREGEFAECPVGVLDTQGEKGQKWLVSPWLPSPRNITDAARTLGHQSGRKRREREA